MCMMNYTVLTTNVILSNCSHLEFSLVFLVWTVGVQMESIGYTPLPTGFKHSLAMHTLFLISTPEVVLGIYLLKLSFPTN